MTTSLSFDLQLAAAIATTDPAERYRALEAVRVELNERLDVERGRAVRDLALAKGPRDFGPKADRELNWEAAGRDLGFSGDTAKKYGEQAEPVAV